MGTSVGTVFRSTAEKKVLDAGYDPARLPPGQYLTEKWPVLHAGSVPSTDLARWDLRVLGQDETALLAYEANGEELTPDHGWPLRLVIPGKYFWKSAKWLRAIELRSTDQP